MPDGGRGNDGDLIADVPAEMILEDTLEPNPDPDKHVFLFNPVTDQVDQRIDVPDDVALSPGEAPHLLRVGQLARSGLFEQLSDDRGERCR